MKKLLLPFVFFLFSFAKAQVSTPDICMVGTDSTKPYNYIIWDKTLYPNADTFIVYREVTTNNYAFIGVRAADSLSIFYDTARSIGPVNGDPTIGYYRYKIQMKDTLGQTSPMSNYHSTVFLTNDTSGTFFWNYYFVENNPTPVVYYELQCDTNNTGFWKNVGMTSCTQTVLHDPAYQNFRYTGRWRLVAHGFNCTPTFKQTAGIQSNYSVSYSNIVSNFNVGIKNITVKEINVYPNPARNEINISSPTMEMLRIEIFDVFGRNVYTEELKGKKKIDISALSEGVYTIKGQSAEGYFTKKLIVAK